MGAWLTILQFLGFKREFSVDEELVRYRFVRSLRDRTQRTLMCRTYWNQNPRVINTDAAKELCPEYAADRCKYSKCIYEPAKDFVE